MGLDMVSVCGLLAFGFTGWVGVPLYYCVGVLSGYGEEVNCGLKLEYCWFRRSESLRRSALRLYWENLGGFLG